MKGQAAIEYLSTYGLAIFVIVIVMAALLFFFSSVGQPEFCNVQPQGFTCGDVPPVATLSNNEVSITMKFGNEQDKAIKLISAVCVQGNAKEYTGNGDIKDMNEEMLSPGSSKEIANIPCHPSSDSPDPVTSSPGQQFRGTVIIKYKYSTDFENIPPRTAIASISTKVVG